MCNCGFLLSKFLLLIMAQVGVQVSQFRKLSDTFRAITDTFDSTDDFTNRYFNYFGFVASAWQFN
jgi:hypothetical protein